MSETEETDDDAVFAIFACRNFYAKINLHMDK